MCVERHVLLSTDMEEGFSEFVGISGAISPKRPVIRSLELNPARLLFTRQLLEPIARL